MTGSSGTSRPIRFFAIRSESRRRTQTECGPGHGCGKDHMMSCRRVCGPPGDVGVEPTLGFEPRTCCLRNSCSTTELCRRGAHSSSPAARGTPPASRRGVSADAAKRAQTRSPEIACADRRLRRRPRMSARHRQQTSRGRKRASRCHTAGGTDVTRGSCIRKRAPSAFVRPRLPAIYRPPPSDRGGQRAPVQRGCNAGAVVGPMRVPGQAHDTGAPRRRRRRCHEPGSAAPPPPR